MNSTQQKLDQIYNQIGKPMARDCSLAEVRDAAVRLEFEATGYNQSATAKNLDVGVSFMGAWVKRQRALAALCACVLVLCGCVSNQRPKAKGLNIGTPPLPIPLTALSSRTTIKSNRVDGSLIVAPPAPAKLWRFTWTGSTNGWIAEISFRHEITAPWRVVGWATNTTSWTAPTTGTQGFYAVTKMTDMDNPINVWVGRR